MAFPNGNSRSYLVFIKTVNKQNQQHVVQLLHINKPTPILNSTDCPIDLYFYNFTSTPSTFIMSTETATTTTTTTTEQQQISAPSKFLNEITSTQVIVKLYSGEEYHGMYIYRFNHFSATSSIYTESVLTLN